MSCQPSPSPRQASEDPSNDSSTTVEVTIKHSSLPSRDPKLWDEPPLVHQVYISVLSNHGIMQPSKPSGLRAAQHQLVSTASLSPALRVNPQASKVHPTAGSSRGLSYLTLWFEELGEGG